MDLTEIGLLKEVDVTENRTVRRPTDLGLSMGIILEARTRDDGTSYVLFFIKRRRNNLYLIISML